MSEAQPLKHETPTEQQQHQYDPNRPNENVYQPLHYQPENMNPNNAYPYPNQAPHMNAPYPAAPQQTFSPNYPNYPSGYPTNYPQNQLPPPPPFPDTTFYQPPPPPPPQCSEKNHGRCSDNGYSSHEDEEEQHIHHLPLPLSPPEYIRQNRFLSKVLSIVAIQLVIVSLMSYLMNNYQSVQTYVQESFWLWIISLVFEFGSLIAMFCLRKQKPYNYILLAIFTVSSGYFVSLFTTYFDVVAILEAVLITTITVVALILYTLLSRRDFRWLGAGLYAMTWVLLFWCLFSFLFLPMGWFGPAPPFYTELIALVGIVLFVGYLLYDLSRLMHQYDEDEYILGAIDLYLDIINLFMCILMLIGGNRRD